MNLVPHHKRKINWILSLWLGLEPSYWPRPSAFNHSVKLILQDMLNLWSISHVINILGQKKSYNDVKGLDRDLKSLALTKSWSVCFSWSHLVAPSFRVHVYRDVLMLIVTCLRIWHGGRSRLFWGKSLLLLTAMTKTRKTSLAYNSIGLIFYTLSWAWSISTSQTSTCKPGTCTPSTWYLPKPSWDLNPGLGVQI